MPLKKTRRILAAALSAGAASSVLPASAGAATSFCGSGADQNASVWMAVQNYKVATQSVSFNRNCLFCHSSVSGFEYVRAAFEIDILGDWLKSSYWAPGYSKAYAAASRMNMRLMPPGKWPDLLVLAPEPTHTALQNKIWEWMDLLAGCGANSACIWGSAVKPPAGSFGDLQQCNWQLCVNPTTGAVTTCAQ
jgi:hypothetical protein